MCDWPVDIIKRLFVGGIVLETSCDPCCFHGEIYLGFEIKAVKSISKFGLVNAEEECDKQMWCKHQWGIYIMVTGIK